MAVTGCTRTPAAKPPLAIARTSPALDESAPPLLLNDAITIYFSEPILPVSVTSDSVTLVDEAGQQVPGSLRVSSNWITFEPVSPLAPSLDDGSYRPGASYRLLVAGAPRPDAIRALDGRRLATPAAFPVRIARLDERPAGLPAILRPSANELPFMLPPLAGGQLPASEPRLHLQFTQPVLPSSVVPEAFQVMLIATPPIELLPRHVRVLSNRLDTQGCTVEIDLGALPARANGDPSQPLKPGEVVSVALGRGRHSVVDYSGAPPLPTPAQLWGVVAGNSITLLEWPSGDNQLHGDGELTPGFETSGGQLRPRVRVEAGDGSLGILRPLRDLVLRPGQPFDRGDGEIVVSQRGRFAFLAIDIPKGVTVRVEPGATPVQLLAAGSVRILGDLVFDVAAAPVPPRQLQQPLAELAAAVPAAIIAAGDVELGGRILATAGPVEGTTSLLLASASSIELRGALPFQTLLAVEARGEAGTAAIRGARGQSIVFDPAFTYGLAAGADFALRALTPWRPLPPDRDGGVVSLLDQDRDLQVAWQQAPADAVRKNAPDLSIGRVGRLETVRHGDPIAFPAGSFVRFAFTARARAGQPLPRLRELRLTDR